MLADELKLASAREAENLHQFLNGFQDFNFVEDSQKELHHPKVLAVSVCRLTREHNLQRCFKN